jgi:hypothetical protein
MLLTCGDTAVVMRACGCYRSARAGERGVRGGAGDFQGAGGLGDGGAVGDQAAERGDLGRPGHFRAADVLLAGQHPAFGLAAPGGRDPFGLAFGAQLQLVLGGGGQTANMNRPSLVFRSKFSVSDFTVTPRPRSSLLVVRTCAAERPHRSDFQNTSVSPGCRADRAAVNSGRSTPRLPDSFSANSRLLSRRP